MCRRCDCGFLQPEWRWSGVNTQATFCSRPLVASLDILDYLQTTHEVTKWLLLKEIIFRYQNEMLFGMSVELCYFW